MYIFHSPLLVVVLTQVVVVHHNLLAHLALFREVVTLNLEAMGVLAILGRGTHLPVIVLTVLQVIAHVRGL